MAQAKQVAEMGAVIEICFLPLLAGPNAPLAFLTHWTQVNAKHVAQALKEFGAEHVLVSTDLGQSSNMVHPDGVEAAIAAMKKEGIADADIDTMMRKAPARLLGLKGRGLPRRGHHAQSMGAAKWPPALPRSPSFYRAVNEGARLARKARVPSRKSALP